MKLLYNNLDVKLFFNSSTTDIERHKIFKTENEITVLLDTSKTLFKVEQKIFVMRVRCKDSRR